MNKIKDIHEAELKNRIFTKLMQRVSIEKMPAELNIERTYFEILLNRIIKYNGFKINNMSQDILRIPNLIKENKFYRDK